MSTAIITLDNETIGSWLEAIKRSFQSASAAQGEAIRVSKGPAAPKILRADQAVTPKTQLPRLGG